MKNNFDFKYFFTLFLAGVCTLLFLPYNNENPVIIQKSEQSSKAFAQSFEYKILNSDIYSFEETAELSELDLQEEENNFEIMNNNWNQLTSENKEGFELTTEEFENYEASVEQTEKNIIQFQAITPPQETVKPEVSAEDRAKLITTEKKMCSQSSLGIENQINASSILKSLRSADYQKNFTGAANETVFNKMCLAYAMNSFPAGYAAKCPNGPRSLPLPGGTKPCITNTMVDITYNTYMEVMTCMGLNPKHVYPKLFNESGFLINTLGGGFDAGVAQMTKSGIEGANQYYNTAMKNISNLAQSKTISKAQASCARLLQYKSLLSMAPESKPERCSMISPPENPLKGFFYSGLLNLANIENAKKSIIENNLEARIKKLGYKNVDINSLAYIIGTLAYNSGLSVSMNALKTYVQLKELHKLTISESDFDFSETKESLDIDNETKSVIKIALANVKSSYLMTKQKLSAETPIQRQIRLKRRAALPLKISSSFRLSFPEHLVYRQNQNYVQGSKVLPANFKVSGAPGYISFLKRKDTEIRAFLTSVNKNPDLCSDPRFLNTKK